MILTLDRHRLFEEWTGLQLRVLMDGVDITDRCVCADAGRGWAAVYRLDDAGRRYRDGRRGQAATALLEGVVTLRVRRPAHTGRRP